MWHQIAIALVAASSPNQFNLECTGTEEVKVGHVVDSATPYTKTYRIDLDQKLWCEGECRGVKPIDEVQPAYLILDGDTARSIATVDRITGAHKAGRIRSRGRWGVKTIMTGQCKREPFTGFPSFETQF